MHELKALERRTPNWSIPTSPTQRVGGRPAEGFATVRHLAPMLSLDNAYGEADLREFHARLCRALGREPSEALAYVAELKIDGLSIALTYEHGRLARAVTRGDGVEGEDVTRNVRVIQAMPLKLRDPSPPAAMEVRGEVYLPARGLRAHERGARGSGRAGVRQSHEMPRPAPSVPSITPPWASADCGPSPIRSSTPDGAELAALRHQDVLRQLSAWSCPVEPHWRVCVDIDAVVAFCEEWREARRALPVRNGRCRGQARRSGAA